MTLRDALKAHDTGVRLVAPTATMAEHLRHQLAREGFVVRPRMIATLAKFIQPWVEDLPQVSSAGLYLLVERALRQLRPAEYEKVAELPGFAAALARTIDEFAAAGCTGPRVGGAFGLVFREVERQLERRALGLRNQRLGRAAERIERAGIGGVHTVWFEGFFSLTAPEQRLVDAVRRHASVVVADPLQDARARAVAPKEIFRAESPDREAEEIARRILEEAARGREFRECGVIARSVEEVAGPLAAAFDRFGIPARLYAGARLAEQPVARYMGGLVEALLAGWDHAKTLAALRAAGSSQALDRFDFQVRRRTPGRGLEPLIALGAPELGLERLRPLERWTALALSAAEWAAKLKTLRGLVEPPPPGEVPSRERGQLRRADAAALAALDQALDEAAAFLAGDGAMPLERFWSAAAAVVRLTPLRVPDARRNVVHVLSVHEARQWELPLVFVCGLNEGRFPKHHPQDPFFTDAARRELQRAGLRVRTSAELEREERQLFDFACTRATARLVLSCAERDERGNAVLPSSFLEDEIRRAGPLRDRRGSETPLVNAVAEALEPAQLPWVRPSPRRAVTAAPTPRIESPALLRVLEERHATLSPSGLESFLVCPFQFFAARTLRLRDRPPQAAERLDFLLRGNIVHEVLALARSPEELEAAFDQVFRRLTEAHFVPQGYAAEACRQEMLEDLRRFFAKDELPRAVERRVEQKFELALSDGVTVRGRIDRVDRLADGRALVIDYKYSRAERVAEKLRGEEAVQGPLYVLAAERVLGWRVAAMHFISLRKKARFADLPMSPEKIEEGRLKTLAAAARIRSGAIAPSPSDTGQCRWCDYRDVCRYEGAAAAAAAEGE